MTQENDRPFLERYGYAHKALQIESMDTALKNGLWNAFVQHVWDSNPAGPNVASMTSFCENLWGDHFKEKEDDLRRFEGRSFYRYNRDYLRTEFRNRFDGSNWYEVSHLQNPNGTSRAKYSDLIFGDVSASDTSSGHLQHF